MSDKTLKTRIQHKRGTANDWSQATNFIPLDGELIIYNEKDGTSPKFKVGDGVTLVGNLPFVTSESTEGGDYLSLTGGTLTGSLAIDRGANYSDFRINRIVNEVKNSSIIYLANNGNLHLDKRVGDATENFLNLTSTNTTLGKPLALNSGGTGATTANEAEFNINGGIGEATDNVVDSTPLVFARTSPSAASGVFYKRSASKLWDYINNKVSNSYLPLSGGTLTGALTGTSITASETIKAGANFYVIKDSYPSIYLKNASETELARIYMATGAGAYSNLCFRVWKDADTSYDATLKTDGSFNANKVYGAVWNDYAEFRMTVPNIKPGQVVVENGNGSLSISTKRLQAGCEVVSDTYGFAIGETEKAKTPIAVSGRVLVYTYEDRNTFIAGEPVCSGPNGTVSRMTREEAKEYPERIIGTVSEIPEYEVWGTEEVVVDGRIWIRIK